MLNIKQILCPVDLSEASNHAIEQASVIAGWYKARITALHVYDPVFMPIPGLPAADDRVTEAEVRRVHDRTAACFQQATAAGIVVDVVIDRGRPAAEILNRGGQSARRSDRDRHARCRRLRAPRARVGD